MTIYHITNQACSAAISDFGATVISWRPQGFDEVFHIDPHQDEPNSDVFHAGLPICAPWFGKGRDEVEVPHIHGLVRRRAWRLIDRIDRAAETILVFQITQAELADIAGANDYPEDLVYLFTVNFGANLSVDLQITSPTADTVIDAAFHGYYRVNDIAQTKVSGVDATLRRDYRVADAGGQLESIQHGDLAPAFENDSIFFGALAANPVTLSDPQRKLTLTSSTASDVVVWNPSREQSFICVEAGNVQRNALTLAAGETIHLGFNLELSALD